MVGNSIPIPRSKYMQDFLASNGLMGKIKLLSSMTHGEIMRFVFSVPMRNQSNVVFRSCNHLVAIASPCQLIKNGQLRLLLGKIARCQYNYVLAIDDLKVKRII